MDAVKNFDIQIDLDKCAKLYDYARFEYIYRPPGGWDMAALSSRNKEPEYPDETSQMIVRKMDEIHIEKGMLEKSADGKTKEKEKSGMYFEGFSSLDDDKMPLPKRVLPVFQPGDHVTGYVYLELKQSTDAESLNIKFKGNASTNIRIYHRYGWFDERGDEVYVNQKDVMWMKTGTQDSSKQPLVATTVPTANKLSAGVHKFPFSYRIPDDARQSVPHLLHRFNILEDCWAYISYYLKATINKGKSMKKGNILCNKGIWVEQVYDIRSNPSDMEPVNEMKKQSTGVFSKGNITIRASMPARAFKRIDNIPIKLEINNESKDSIESVKARVIMTGSYRARAKWSVSCSIKVKGTSAKEGPVSAGEHPVFNLSVPLEFRENGVDGNLIPAGSLNNCDIIDVEYNLHVMLKRKGMHRDMGMVIPIYVGTHDSKEEPLYPRIS